MPDNIKDLLNLRPQDTVKIDPNVDTRDSGLKQIDLNLMKQYYDTGLDISKVKNEDYQSPLDTYYSNENKWLNDLGRLGTGAVSSIVGGFAMLPAFLDSVESGDLSKMYENGAVKWAESLDEWGQEKFKNHYSKNVEQAYKEASIFEKMTYVEKFWGNSLLANAGFAIGAVVDEAIFTALSAATLGGTTSIQAAWTGLTLAKVARRLAEAGTEVMGSGAGLVRNIGRIGEGLSTSSSEMLLQGLKGTAKNSRQLLTSAGYESAVEALQFKKEATEQQLNRKATELGITKEELESNPAYEKDLAEIHSGINNVANGLWLMNLATVGSSNAIGATALFGLEKPILNALEAINPLKRFMTSGVTIAAGEATAQTLSKGAKAFNLLKSPLSEGMEEFAQGIYQDVGKKYLEDKYNPSGMDMLIKGVPLMAQQVAERLGDSSHEGWEEFASGFVSSMFGLPNVGRFVGKREDGTYGLKNDKSQAAWVGGIKQGIDENRQIQTERNQNAAMYNATKDEVLKQVLENKSVAGSITNSAITSFPAIQAAYERYEQSIKDGNKFAQNEATHDILAYAAIARDKIGQLDNFNKDAVQEFDDHKSILMKGVNDKSTDEEKTAYENVSKQYLGNTIQDKLQEIDRKKQNRQQKLNDIEAGIKRAKMLNLPESLQDRMAVTLSYGNNRVSEANNLLRDLNKLTKVGISTLSPSELNAILDKYKISTSKLQEHRNNLDKSSEDLNKTTELFIKETDETIKKSHADKIEQIENTQATYQKALDKETARLEKELSSKLDKVDWKADNPLQQQREAIKSLQGDEKVQAEQLFADTIHAINQHKKAVKEYNEIMGNPAKAIKQEEDYKNEVPEITTKKPVVEKSKPVVTKSEVEKTVEKEKTSKENVVEVNKTESKENKIAEIEKRRQEDLETTKNIGEDKLKEGRENTKKLVEYLKQRYPATSAQGIIIRILEKLIDFNKYSTIIDSDYLNGKNASGQATWFGMIISQETFDGILAGKEFEVYTFIHEFIHGFTTSKISDYNIEKQGLIPGFKSKLTAKEKNAIKQLQRIFEKVKKDNPKSKEYGFTNLDEFIAEAFSNTSFQYTLKNTKAEGKKSNLFSEFIEAIGDLLFEQLERWAKRFNKEIPERSTITGILEDVLAWTEDLIDQNNKLAYIATNEEINAKYDAELAALETPVVEGTTKKEQEQKNANEKARLEAFKPTIENVAIKMFNDSVTPLTKEEMDFYADNMKEIDALRASYEVKDKEESEKGKVNWKQDMDFLRKATFIEDVENLDLDKYKGLFIEETGQAVYDVMNTVKLEALARLSNQHAPVWYNTDSITTIVRTDGGDFRKNNIQKANPNVTFVNDLTSDISELDEFEVYVADYLSQGTQNPSFKGKNPRTRGIEGAIGKTIAIVKIQTEQEIKENKPKIIVGYINDLQFGYEKDGKIIKFSEKGKLNPNFDLKWIGMEHISREDMQKQLEILEKIKTSDRVKTKNSKLRFKHNAMNLSDISSIENNPDVENVIIWQRKISSEEIIWKGIEKNVNTNKWSYTDGTRINPTGKPNSNVIEIKYKNGEVSSIPINLEVRDEYVNLIKGLQALDKQDDSSVFFAINSDQYNQSADFYWSSVGNTYLIKVSDAQLKDNTLEPIFATVSIEEYNELKESLKTMKGKEAVDFFKTFINEKLKSTKYKIFNVSYNLGSNSMDEELNAGKWIIPAMFTNKIVISTEKSTIVAQDLGSINELDEEGSLESSMDWEAFDEWENERRKLNNLPADMSLEEIKQTIKDNKNSLTKELHEKLVREVNKLTDSIDKAKLSDYLTKNYPKTQISNENRDLTHNKAMEIFKQYFPETAMSLGDVSDVIGKLTFLPRSTVLGVYDGLVRFSHAGVANSTPYFEGFRLVFNALISDKEREAILTEATIKYFAGVSKEQRIKILNEFQKSYVPLTENGYLYKGKELFDYYLETKLAQDFVKKTQKKENKSFIQRFFNRLLEWIGLVKRNKANELFTRILNKEFVNVPYNAQSATVKTMLETTNSFESHGQTIYFDDIMDSTDSYRIANRILHLRTQGLSFDEALAKTIQYYEELQQIANNKNKYYAVQKLQSIINDLTTEDMFGDINDIAVRNIQKLREEVKDRLKEMTFVEMEESEDIKTDEDTTQEDRISATTTFGSNLKEIGGEMSASKMFKEYLSTMMYEEDEFNLGLSQDELKKFMIPVDYIGVYNKMLQLCAGKKRSEYINKEGTGVLNKMAKISTEIESVVNQMIASFGNGEWSENSIYNMVTANLEKQLLLDKIVIYDEKGQVKVLNANAQNVISTQINKWASEFETNVRDNVTLVREVEDGLKAIKSALKKTKSTEEFRKEQSEKLYTMLKDFGMRVSPTYCDWCIEQATFEGEQFKLDTLTAKATVEYGLKKENNILFDANIEHIFTEIKSRQTFNEQQKAEGNTPLEHIFADKDLSPEERSLKYPGINLSDKKENRGKGAKEKLNEIARANGIFDTQIRQSSYKNAAGKTIYEIINRTLVGDIMQVMNKENLDEFSRLKNLGENRKFDPKYKSFINTFFQCVATDVSNSKEAIEEIDDILTDLGEWIFDNNLDFYSDKFEIGFISGFQEVENNENKGYTFSDADARGKALTLIGLWTEGWYNPIVAAGKSMQFIIKGNKKERLNDKDIKETKDTLFNWFDMEVRRIARAKDLSKNIDNSKRGESFFINESFVNSLVGENIYNAFRKAVDKEDQKLIDEAKKQFFIDYENQEYKDKLKEKLFQFHSNLADKFAEKIISDTEGELPEKLSKDFDKDNVKALREMYFDDHINSQSFIQAFTGDPAMSFKNILDMYKRAGSFIGGGMSNEGRRNMVSMGINSIKHKLGIDEYDIDKEFYEAKGKDYLINGDSVDSTDAQSYQTVDSAIEFYMKSSGKYRGEVAKILNYINLGIEVGNKEWTYLDSQNAALQVRKMFYAGRLELIKTSVNTLTWQECSIWNKEMQEALEGKTLDEQVQILKDKGITNKNVHKYRIELPHRKAYFDTLSLMTTQNIDYLYHSSASKRMQRKVNNNGRVAFNNFESFEGKHEIFANERKHYLNPQFWKEQVATDGVKTEIVHGTQMLQLIWSEQNGEAKVTIGHNDFKLNDLTDAYLAKMAERIEMQYQEVSEHLAIDPDYLRKSFVESLKSSGATTQTIKFFEKSNLNLPHVVEKTEYMFFSKMSKILSHKKSGSAMALTSPKLYDVLRATKDITLENGVTIPKGEVISTETFKKHYTSFDESNSTKSRLRHGIPVLKSDGSISHYNCEIILPANHPALAHMKDGFIPARFAEMVGIRIPTQDKHSMLSMKVVDVIPAYKGATIIVPLESILLSGEDFDIDKKFFYNFNVYKNKQGDWVRYGDYTTVEQMEEELVKLVLSENEDISKEVKELNKGKDEIKKELSKAYSTLKSLLELKKTNSYKEYGSEVMLLKGLYEDVERLKEELKENEINLSMYPKDEQFKRWVNESKENIKNTYANIETVKEKMLESADEANVAEIKKALTHINTILASYTGEIQQIEQAMNMFKKELVQREHELFAKMEVRRQQNIKGILNKIATNKYENANDLLALEIPMIHNNGNNDIAYSPAEMKTVNNSVICKVLFVDENRKLLAESLGKTLEQFDSKEFTNKQRVEAARKYVDKKGYINVYTATSPLDKLTAYYNNDVGSSNIGIWAVSNVFMQAVMRAKVGKLTTEDGKILLGKMRYNDIISSYLSSSTDNDKEQHAAILQLDSKRSSLLHDLCWRTGFHPELGLAILHDSEGMEKATVITKEQFDDVAQGILDEVDKTDASMMEEVQKDFPFAGLDDFKGMNQAKLATWLMKNKDKKEAIIFKQYLVQQADISSSYSFNVTQLLQLNKGFKGTLVANEALWERIDIVKNGIEVDGKKVKPFDGIKVIETNDHLKKEIERFVSIYEGETPKHFLNARLKPYLRAISKTLKYITMTKNRNKLYRDINSSLIVGMVMKTDIMKFANLGKDKSIFTGVITALKSDLLKTNRNNPLINGLSNKTVKYKSGNFSGKTLDYVAINTWLKAVKFVDEKLQNEFERFAMRPDALALIDERLKAGVSIKDVFEGISEDEKKGTIAKLMFIQSVIKDGLQFKSGTVSKLLPTRMFDEISTTLDAIMSGDKTIKEVFNKSNTEIIVEQLTNFLLDETNKGMLPKAGRSMNEGTITRYPFIVNKEGKYHLEKNDATDAAGIDIENPPFGINYEFYQDKNMKEVILVLDQMSEVLAGKKVANPTYTAYFTKGNKDISGTTFENRKTALPQEQFYNKRPKLEYPFRDFVYKGVYYKVNHQDVQAKLNQTKKKEIIVEYLKTVPKGKIEPLQEESKVVGNYKFTYKGKTIDTDFQLSNDQELALQQLIDFKLSNSTKPITLQGAAGTGKTSIIGYLQKYFKQPFLYLAPTHAATVQLGYATFKTGNKTLPATVRSSVYVKKDNKGNFVSLLTNKGDRKLNGGNTIVIDESSMLDKKDYEALKNLAEDYKIIFMGDKKQIPEVNSNNPQQKEVSKAFTENQTINLDVIHRTSNENIKNILQKIRDNVAFQLYKIKENTEHVKFVRKIQFDNLMKEYFQKEPEDTVYIGYTNTSVNVANKWIRENVFGRTGVLQVGDIVMGYLGYESKQVEKGNLANSIAFKVDSIEKTNKDVVGYSMVIKSELIDNLRDKGFSEIPKTFTAIYVPLSKEETIEHEMSVEEMTKSNKYLSKKFGELNVLFQAAQSNKSLWYDYESTKASIGSIFMNVNLAQDYIYNANTGLLEPYNKKAKSPELVNLYGTKFNDFVVEKGIDFGHAITVHKSQGSTIKNVFFDANTIGKGDTIITENGNRLSTENQSLGYVAMSRASENLIVNEGWVNFEEIDNVEENQPVEANDKVTSMNQITNHSGGAIGADTMFDVIGREFGVVNHNHYWANQKTPKGNVELTPEQLQEGIIHAKQAAIQLGRPFADKYANLLGRNWFQIKNSTQVIAIAPIVYPNETNSQGYKVKANRATVDGGTGYAVEMAIANGKEVNVFDTKTNQWYKWNGVTFVKSEVPILQKDFAGIGSRQDNGKMTTESIQAIRDVYQKTQNSLNISEQQNPASIYKNLGDKTVSNNIVIKSVYQQEGIKYAKSIGGIFSLRINNSNTHFGNPFSSVPAEIAKGLIPTNSTKESVEKYIDWVINSQDERANWIREQLKSGILKNKPIVYYKELGEPSHATALDYLINKYDWKTNESKSSIFEKIREKQSSQLNLQTLVQDFLDNANEEIIETIVNSLRDKNSYNGDEYASVYDYFANKNITTEEQFGEEVNKLCKGV